MLIRQAYRLDGRSYGNYKQLCGSWDYGDFQLHIDRVQSDPFAPPSACRITLPWQTTTLSPQLPASAVCRVGIADFLARRANQVFRRNRSAGKGQAELRIAGVGQEILARSSVQILALNPTKNTFAPDRAQSQPNQLPAATPPQYLVELRVQIPFPARGRTIMGRSFADFLDRDLPDQIFKVVDFAILGGPSASELNRHLETLADYLELRRLLAVHGWVAFVADGAILARESGISDLPMKQAVPFSLPPVAHHRELSVPGISAEGEDGSKACSALPSQHASSKLNVTVELPHAGKVRGMAIPKGITLIVGGGYHGKSTLLQALERAVYPHIPGDGRELVATEPSALKVRAEDGRSISGVDISLFITGLPGKTETRRFFTPNASGSTSQAAAISEGIEGGAGTLLIDEDTSATNLLLRDQRMRQLIAAEPITPLLDRVQGIRDQLGVSLIMVMGGSGDYLDLADQVLLLNNYQTWDAGGLAQKVCQDFASSRGKEGAERQVPWPQIPIQVRKLSICPPAQTGRREKTKASGLDTLLLNREEIDISALAQVVDPGQAEAIAWGIRRLVSAHWAKLPEFGELARIWQNLVEQESWSAYQAGRYPAFLVQPRPIDLICALNRYRQLRTQ